MTATTTTIAHALNASAPRCEGEIRYLLTDSRSLSAPEHTLFFALRTSGNDGHRYISELYSRGVRYFVADHIPAEMEGAEDAVFFIVNDTAEALRKTGALHKTLPAHRVAITGSRGKTTLKEWIFQLMEPQCKIARSPRSFNSQIGVPLSLWEINADTDMAIIEAGVSREGEMKGLAEIIAPQTVILTNIASEHDEGFCSREAKAAEKARLAAPQSVGCLIYGEDDPLICGAVKRYCSGRRVITWSRRNPEATLLLKSVENGGERETLRAVYAGSELTVGLPGRGAAAEENAMLALAFMISEGIEPCEAAERISRMQPVDTRLDVTEGVNRCSLIYDGFTSDFSSLVPALDFMRRRHEEGNTLTLVVSDLHNEARSAEDTYRDVASLTRNFGISRVVGIGPVISSYRALFGEASEFYLSTEEFLSHRSPFDFDHETILIKGSPEFGFWRVLDMLETRKHETVLEVDLEAVAKNYNYFRSFLPPSTGIVGMVKASAYGVGSLEIARTLQDRGAAYLAVAVLDEGIQLRDNGITMPIMVLNPKVLNYKSLFDNRLEPEIFSFGMLDDVISEARKNNVRHYPVHIKLDTGMHRLGFMESELPALMDRLESQDFVSARSVFSHLATADCPDMDDYTEMQLECFRRCSDYMLSRSSHPILRHVLNSAGILRYPSHHYDMARLGIGLYGVETLPPQMEAKLCPVAALRTVIIAIRDRVPGDTIGYGRHGLVEKPSRIATIPIGYADGMNRHFGRGNVSVLVNGRQAPTIGNICMDQCMIDVTGIDCKVGDRVEIFGPEAPIQRLADTLDTIPYEVLTSVSPRVKRIYFRG